MQEQLTELQLKLAKEEEEKINVTKLNQDLKQVIDYSHSYFSPPSAVIFHFFSPHLILLIELLQISLLPGTIHYPVLSHGESSMLVTELNKSAPCFQYFILIHSKQFKARSFLRPGLSCVGGWVHTR